MKVLYFIIFLALSTLVGVLNYNHAPNYDTDVVALEDINQVLSEAEKTILKVMISRQIEFHNQHLLLPKKIVIPTRIFDTRKEFKRYQKENTKRSDSNNGFYSRSLREIVIRQNKRAMKTIVHEAQHYIIGSDFRKPPKWLNQGLSEFYEESYVRWKKVYVTVQKKKLSRLEKWVHEDSMIPFRYYLSVPYKDWEDINDLLPRANSTIAWGLVYFFMSTDKRKKLLSEIIKDLKQSPKASSYRTLNRLYPGGVKSLEKDFASFILDMPQSIEI